MLCFRKESNGGSSKTHYNVENANGNVMSQLVFDVNVGEINPEGESVINISQHKKKFESFALLYILLLCDHPYV